MTDVKKQALTSITTSTFILHTEGCILLFWTSQNFKFLNKDQFRIILDHWTLNIVLTDFETKHRCLDLTIRTGDPRLYLVTGIWPQVDDSIIYFSLWLLWKACIVRGPRLVVKRTWQFHLGSSLNFSAYTDLYSLYS